MLSMSKHQQTHALTTRIVTAATAPDRAAMASQPVVAAWQQLVGKHGAVVAATVMSPYRSDVPRADTLGP